MTDSERNATRYLCAAVIQACAGFNGMGAPGGHLYAALMSAGITLAQFYQVMGSLQRLDMVTRSGECYTATAKGRAFAAAEMGAA